MNKNKQKKSASFVIGVILYVFSGLAAVQLIRVFLDINGVIANYISEAAAYGYGISFGEYIDIIFYYIEGCTQPLFSGSILFALAWIIMQKAKKEKYGYAVDNDIPSELDQTEEEMLSEDSEDNVGESESEDEQKDDEIDKYTQ